MFMIKKEDETNPQTKKMSRVILCTSVIATVALAYAAGGKVEKRKMSYAIEEMWKKDPSLKEHMWNALVDVMKEQ